MEGTRLTGVAMPPVEDDDAAVLPPRPHKDAPEPMDETGDRSSEIGEAPEGNLWRESRPTNRSGRFQTYKYDMLIDVDKLCLSVNLAVIGFIRNFFIYLL